MCCLSVLVTYLLLLLLLLLFSHGGVKLEVSGRMLSDSPAAHDLEAAADATSPASADDGPQSTMYEIQVSVTDTGIGISESNIKKLFHSVRPTMTTNKHTQETEVM